MHVYIDAGVHLRGGIRHMYMQKKDKPERPHAALLTRVHTKETWERIYTTSQTQAYGRTPHSSHYTCQAFMSSNASLSKGALATKQWKCDFPPFWSTKLQI